MQNTCAIFLWWEISWMASLRDHKHSPTPLQCSDYEKMGSAYDDLHSQTSPNLHNGLAYLMWHCPSQVLGIFHSMPLIQGLFPCSGILYKFPEIFLWLWGSKPDKIDLTFCAISQLLCIKLVSCIGLLNYDMLKSYGSEIHLYWSVDSHVYSFFQES